MERRYNAAWEMAIRVAFVMDSGATVTFREIKNQAKAHCGPA
jgi:HKD family nuclease